MTDGGARTIPSGVCVSLDRHAERCKPIDEEWTSSLSLSKQCGDRDRRESDQDVKDVQPQCSVMTRLSM